MFFVGGLKTFSVIFLFPLNFETDAILFQELIFKLEGFKPFGWYLTLVQFACYTVIGVVEMQFKEDKTRK